MNKEIENRILVLYAIMQLGGASNKKDVLDYIENQHLIILTDYDNTMLASRKEKRWRNELAYVRSHLVELKALNVEEWAITTLGKVYYNMLIEQLNSYAKGNYMFKRLRRPSEFTMIDSIKVSDIYEAIREAIDDSNSYIISDIIKEVVNETSYASVYEAIVKCRIGQDRYRSGLIKLYNGKCSVTGYGDPQLLIASHIKPWSHCGTSQEKTDVYNGLLLLPNIDKLFDKYLITFDSVDGHIVIADSVVNKETLGIRDDMKITVYDKSRKYLEYHNRELFVDREKYYKRCK